MSSADRGRTLNAPGPSALELDVEKELRIKELRSGFIKYTVEAFRRLPSFKQPRILDIGCGWGASMFELSRLCDGTFVGIDIDDVALDFLQDRIERENLSDRLTARRSSLIGVDLPDHSFDVVWEEGVIHILDVWQSLAECARLLKPGGFLVSCETVEWSENHREDFRNAGFELVETVLWKKGCWWTDYYEPLERRVRQFRENLGSASVPEALRRYEAEIEMVRASPEATDCGHYVMRLG